MNDIGATGDDFVVLETGEENNAQQCSNINQSHPKSRRAKLLK